MKRTELKRKTTMARTGILRTASDQLSARVKLITCRGCRQKMAPFRPGARVCSEACSITYSTLVREKNERKKARAERVADRQKLEDLRPLSYWRKKAKTALHAYVRARDEGKPCISCDTILAKTGKPGGDYDAGHFRSVGSAKHLEMDLRNVHGQCKRCNNHKSGNVIEYERRLRARCGDRMVDDLLADNAPRHYRKEDYLAIEADCKARMKELKNG